MKARSRFWCVPAAVGAMKTFALHLLILSCILMSLPSRSFADPLALGATMSGTISWPGQINSYTFTAVAGQVMNFTVATTNGSLMPQVKLRNSHGALIAEKWSGTPPYTGSFLRMNDVLLSKADTYTLEVSDNSSKNTGDYNIYAQSTNYPVGAVNLSLDAGLIGTISLPAQNNTYVVNNNANYSVYVAAQSGSLNPTYLVDMLAGTSTVLVSDNNCINTGSYIVWFGDSKARHKFIDFGVPTSFRIGFEADNFKHNFFFAGNANDVVDFTAVTTLLSFVPKIEIYNPDGTLLTEASPPSCSGGSLEIDELKLPTTGVFKMVVSDCEGTNSGHYNLYAQRTNNPARTSMLPLGQTQSYTIGSPAESRTYVFQARSGDVFDFTLAATGSSGFVPRLRLYNPDGTLLRSASSSPSVEINSVSLPQDGAYTVLVGDYSNQNNGGFKIFAQRTNNPSNADMLVFNHALSDSIAGAADTRTYAFAANTGDVIGFNVGTTSGSLVPEVRLYNPDGSLNTTNYAGAPVDCDGPAAQLDPVTIPLDGRYTLLLSDCSDRNKGGYALYAQSTNDPVRTAPVRWGQLQSAAIKSERQSATFVFGGKTNNVVTFSMATTSGGLVPKIRLYNPDGTLQGSNYAGAPMGCGGAAAQLDSITLPHDGDYTLLLSDCSGTNTGNYSLWSQCSGDCPAMPAISWPSPAAITNITPLISIQLDAVANVPGTFAYSPSEGTFLPPGPHKLSTVFTPANTTKYAAARYVVQLWVNMGKSEVTWQTPAPITYGTALSAAQLDATANLPGAFAYSPQAGTMLSAGNHELSVTFTPADTVNYAVVTKAVPLTVNKAVPTVNWPTPAPITYGTLLSAAQLNAAFSWTVNGQAVTVQGQATYNPPLKALLPAGKNTLTVAFTPTDAANYKGVNAGRTITVNKTTPGITTWPTAGAITYGKSLASSTLSGGTASVPGAFAFTHPATIPHVGTNLQSVTFTPSDTAQYGTATGSVSVTVKKATPSVK